MDMVKVIQGHVLKKVRFQIWATGHDNTCFRVVFREQREKLSQNIVFSVKIGENGKRESWEPVWTPWNMPIFGIQKALGMSF